MKGLEKSRNADRKLDHDDSFPVALDENFQRIPAMEAILWKRRDPNVLFYCPKCIQVDPGHRTIVHPSSHQIPRFNRKKREVHSRLCQYRNASLYMESLAKQFQIELNEKTLDPKLPSFHAGAIMEQSLDTRRSIFDTEEQRRFIQLIESLLQDYDMDLFYQRYGHYSILDAKNRWKFRDIVQTLEKESSDVVLEEGKLSLIVGKIDEVKWSDHYLIAHFDSAHENVMVSLYFHPYHYSKSTVDLLKNRRIACLGYVQKVKESEFRIEILSMDHQIAFLDGNRPHSILAPRLRANLFLDHLLSHAKVYQPLERKVFQRSYYKDQFQQFHNRHVDQERKKQERLQQTLEKIPECNEKILELKVAKEQMEQDFSQHQQRHTTFLQKLRDALLLRTAQVKLKEQDLQEKLQSLTEQIGQTIMELRRLKQERSELKEELNEIEQKRLDLLQQAGEEQKIKRKVQGYLYEYKYQFNDESRRVVIGLWPKADRFNVEVDVTLLDVQKMDGYYLPQYKIQQTFATDGFLGEREIQVMIQKVWRYIDKKVQEISNRVEQEKDGQNGS